MDYPNTTVFDIWLGNVLRVTMVCTFSTSQLPKVVRICGAFSILTSKCASRHNGGAIFDSFAPAALSGATNHWKNVVNRDFCTFSRTRIFFLLIRSLLWSSLCFSSLLWLFPLLFHLSMLSEVWLLSFLRQLYTLIYKYIYNCCVYTTIYHYIQVYTIIYKYTIIFSVLSTIIFTIIKGSWEAIFRVTDDFYSMKGGAKIYIT